MSMTFRQISEAGDWQFGQGRGSYFTRENAIAANVKTSLLFFLNDYFAAMTFGIDWWNLLGSKNPAAKNNILLETRRMLASCYGVARINSVEAVMDNANRRLTIYYNEDSVFSQSIVGSVQTP